MIEIIDTVLFFITTIGVIYLLIFTLASLSKMKVNYPPAKKKNRFVVLFPAYKEDAVILTSVNSFLKQDYPSDYFDVVVISDHMTNETNDKLSKLPVKVLKIQTENSTKAKALNLAISSLNDDYDAVVIMDADNIVEADFITRLNNTLDFGISAIQAHRMAKNMDTEIAVLDAASEEINNSIFKKGHVNLGLSSALSGSGMAFDYKWFKVNFSKIVSTGEDKELELELLRQEIFIEYLEDVPVYDQKTHNKKDFYNQRRRWIASQYYALKKALRFLPTAIVNGNIDYCNKVLQWMMPPRVILVGIVGFFATILLFIEASLSIKWWFLLFLLLFTLAFALPDKMLNEQFRKALKHIPLILILMIINVFRIKGTKDKFIHTIHRDNN